MYYTIRLSHYKKQLWDVVKYTDQSKDLLTSTYIYNKSETIKKSLSYKEATNLATILQKLTKGKQMSTKNEILKDFERYAYIIDLMFIEDYKLSAAEEDDFKSLKLKYKFLR